MLNIECRIGNGICMEDGDGLPRQQTSSVDGKNHDAILLTSERDFCF
jgi:hypothetical protein